MAEGTEIVVSDLTPLALKEQEREKWDKIEEQVTTNPSLSLEIIASTYGVPLPILEKKAHRCGWLNKRDKKNAHQNVNNLNKVTREIAFQINDINEHTFAAAEALQYSFQIEVYKDDEGHIHYKNMDNWEEKPDDFDDFTDTEKEIAIKTISPIKFKNFLDEMDRICNRRMEIINLVTKLTKASLPKADPEILNISRRDGTEKILNNPVGFKKALKASSKELNKDEQDISQKSIDVLLGD